MHSIRSIGSNGVYCQSNNSLAQRLNEAELNSLRHMSSPRSPLALTKAMMRSSSCPIKAGAEHATTVRVCEDQKLNLAEEKLKRKEARRIKREKRDQRRKEDHHRSESLAQKQERRRQEKERKEKVCSKPCCLFNSCSLCMFTDPTFQIPPLCFGGNSSWNRSRLFCSKSR